MGAEPFSSVNPLPAARRRAPFDPRRAPPPAAQLPCYAFGAFRLDLARELLVGTHGPCALRRQAFSVLCVLVQRAPALITHDELLDAVWGHRAISPSAVPQAVRDLRRALGDDARRPAYIETHLRRGYRLLPEVRLDPRGSQAHVACPATPQAGSVAHSRWLPALAANDA
jgi:DNA-binding winged helix-turn-helix (wHTH) protein